ncbi:ergothioneine biosynthesis protein EgtC [Frankia sp. Cppng1_Ct_nod]|uniref:ergothioneine biosynthesis protein EgtC n=1 Tax=Frankia sp. Cppng1_Ct_nod TaxID=2897162 RepID=UPI0010412BA7|nr:ergothioneine biosynthesis protein EgtC [Frankia sp. Cppng1_Ct_nod]
MCRHVAWLGTPRTLTALLRDPPHGLLRQAWTPRRMLHGSINADGFGVGWYIPEMRMEPARYRRAVPIWTDASFASFAGVTRSECVLAAVRNATVGMPVEETSTAPFTDGQHLLSHNGRVDVDVPMHMLAAARDAPVPDSRCDSALLAALVWQRLGTGACLADAVADVVIAAGGKDGAARLNLLVTDGIQIVATTWGETLSYRVSPDGEDAGMHVASEPSDDGDGWVDLDDHRLLVADTRNVTISSLI